jgi:hypothetical protein
MTLICQALKRQTRGTFCNLSDNRNHREAVSRNMADLSLRYEEKLDRAIKESDLPEIVKCLRNLAVYSYSLNPTEVSCQ